MTTTDLSPDDLAAIRARAEAATEGPWELTSDLTVSIPDRQWPNDAEMASTVEGFGRTDAAHVAGMDPTTTLALLALVEGLQGDVARVREVAETANAGCRCDGCNGERKMAARILAALDGPAAGGES